ncbi:hypothetical protein ENSA5_41770 [Enhygromyxa salina]|uniref:Lipoprotein n=1 Tax=Enhygromyxa salina TaxID=215803 RepID=A0A2S9XMI4_9BACT|nr:hypothetical protein [Enhygromyxa salina]PRP94065.1 hypothetical protein ENSA5_41770 [Enhygromyxa salina]
MVSSLARGLVVSCLSLGVWACDEGELDEGELKDSGETGAAAAPSVSPAAARWTLDWDLGATIQAQTSWTTVSDLDYTITVEAAWIGSWGASLVACADAELGAAARVDDAALGVASPWLVAEGHTSGVDDPSAEVFDRVESLIEVARSSYDLRELDGGSYCQAHYLLVPASELSVGYDEAASALAQVDAELELSGASLLIVGSWTPPGGGAATPFVLRSDRAYGKILELEIDPALDAEPGGASVELAIVRHLDAIFDGVAFDAVDLDDAAWTVLGNLGRGTTIVARSLD